MWSRCRTPLTQGLLAVIVSMSTGEFVEVQGLPPEQLRARFGLPASCDPAVTASHTDPSAKTMTVGIECRVKAPAPPPTPSGSGGRREPPTIRSSAPR